MFTKTTALNKLRKLDKRLRVIRGGSSAGKTIAILMILIDYACRNDYREISVVAESVPHLRRGALKDFLNILKALNRYDERKFNRSILKYEFSTGSYIEFFSTDQPDKLRGARRTDLFINECNNISFEAYQQLVVRTSGNIWLDYNPTNLFWVDKELIGQEDTDFLTLTYKDNDSLPESIIKEIEKARTKAKTSTYWANWWRVYGLGEIGSLEGACIPDWKSIDNIPDEARLLCAGLDFGYSVDPSTYIRLYKWNEAYIFDELLYRKGMLNRDISRFLTDKRVLEPIYADSAEPKSIQEIRNYGFDEVASNFIIGMPGDTWHDILTTFEFADKMVNQDKLLDYALFSIATPLPGTEMFETAMALEAACEEKLANKGVYANVDFYSGILYKEIGIPVDLFTPIFAISRTSGWLAHWIEQVSNNKIFRPTQIYTGYGNRKYNSNT